MSENEREGSGEWLVSKCDLSLAIGVHFKPEPVNRQIHVCWLRLGDRQFGPSNQKTIGKPFEYHLNPRQPLQTLTPSSRPSWQFTTVSPRDAP